MKKTRIVMATIREDSSKALEEFKGSYPFHASPMTEQVFFKAFMGGEVTAINKAKEWLKSKCNYTEQDGDKVVFLNFSISEFDKAMKE